MARFTVPPGWTTAQAYRFALDPSPVQARALAAHAGAHESIRKIARRLEAGTARILSVAVSWNGVGRWFCSFQVIVADKSRPAHTPRRMYPVAGVDVGVRDLLVAAAPDGTEIMRVPAPRPLRTAQAQMRRFQREAARRRGPSDPGSGASRLPSNRWRTTQTRIARVHARAAGTRHGEAALAAQWPAGSCPAAGRGATRKTRPAPAVTAGGCETSIPHSNTAGKTGTAAPQGEAA